MTLQFVNIFDNWQNNDTDFNIFLYIFYLILWEVMLQCNPDSSSRLPAVDDLLGCCPDCQDNLTNLVILVR